MESYRRRGFRLPNNTLLLLIIFFTIGLFLHFGGKTQPVVAFWTQIKSILAGEERGPNPYRAPKPYGDTLAIDNGNAAPTTPRSDRGKKPPSQNESKGNRSKKVSDAALAQIIDDPDFFLPAIGSNDQIVRRVGYTLKYAEQYKNPVWVAYILEQGQIAGSEPRENDFMPDPAVRSGTALSSDYTKSGYDRGHMAPAADFKDSYQVMKETFYMSNISPQQPQFNRGVWLELEKMVRAWAYKYQKIYVVTGPVLGSDLSTIGRINQVAVPRQFYKVVLYVNPPYVKGIAFLLNNAPSDARLSSFVVPIDQVEKATGIDFFPTLPDDLAQQAESRSNAGEWYRLK